MLDLQLLETELGSPRGLDPRTLLLVYKCHQFLRSHPDSNLAGAAKALKVAKHELYRAIDRVRKAIALGQVYQRTPGRGSKSTDADDVLFDQIEKILLAYQQLLQTARSRDPVLPVIRIGVPHILSLRLLPRLLLAFRQAHPGTVVRLLVKEPEELLEAAPQGLMDLVLTACPRTYSHADLLAEAELRRCLICPNRHPFGCGGFSWTALDRATESLVILARRPAMQSLPGGGARARPRGRGAHVRARGVAQRGRGA